MTSEIKPNWDFTKVEDLRPYERNAKKHDKPHISNARYFSDIIRDADWFEQI